MNFFDKLKDLRSKISEVENNIYAGKQDYLEIYERNLQLEKEIAERTRDLNAANKRMLTLQHILDMMSSSKPLNSVLESIVNSIKGELGYLHSTIIRKECDENGDYISVIAEAKDEAIDRVNEIIKIPMQARRLVYDTESIYAEALNEKKIIQTKDLRKALYGIIPDMEDEM